MANDSEQHSVNYEYYIRHRNDPESYLSVEQLDQLPAISVRETEKRNSAFIVPGKIYSATDLKNGKYLLRDETGEPNTYDSRRFEVLSEERIRQLKKTRRYQAHKCPACGVFFFSMQESYEICRKCGWVDASDRYLHAFSAEEHGKLYREGKLFFQEWKETMPEGSYVFRRNLHDGYLIRIDVGRDDRMAFAYDLLSGKILMDGSAWADLERHHGNLFVPEYFLFDYQERVKNSNILLEMPIVSREKGCVRAASKGGDPVKVSFGTYIDFVETETLARVYSVKDEVPVNISLDDRSDMNLEAGDICEAKLYSTEYEITIFPNEEEYRKSDINMAPVSMIPRGTFPADPTQKKFRQNALIIFSGKVKEVEWNPRPKVDEPLMRLLIETYALNFNLFCFEDERVEPGYIVHGQVWLNGELRKVET